MRLSNCVCWNVCAFKQLSWAARCVSKGGFGCMGTRLAQQSGGGKCARLRTAGRRLAYPRRAVRLTEVACGASSLAVASRRSMDMIAAAKTVVARGVSRRAARRRRGVVTTSALGIGVGSDVHIQIATRAPVSRMISVSNTEEVGVSMPVVARSREDAFAWSTEARLPTEKMRS